MKGFPWVSRRHCLLFALILLPLTAANGQTLARSPQQTPVPAASPGTNPAGATFVPAKVSTKPDSISAYIRYPKEAVKERKQGAVQFYVDIDARGAVTTSYGLVGKDEVFKRAVQAGLDWGKFEPALLDGKGFPVYLGGTALFFFQNDLPIVAVLLATHDRERVGKIAEYTQPQLIGGLRGYLEGAMRHAEVQNPYGAAAEVLFKIGPNGGVVSSALVAESPPGSKAGEFVLNALRSAKFTPAYAKGQPEAGTVNVVANFSEM